ncbi:protein-disulfide reductase DsbD [Litoribacillus peritrichatus]|uniref:Protein-disulfide reductase DsbD n=1 Tax=Litoribacillus peritrichatus TaxID=718191 RepID=A0ABP7M9F7_9GAMM
MLAERCRQWFLVVLTCFSVFLSAVASAEQGSLWGNNKGGLNLFEQSEPEFLPVDKAFVFESEVVGDSLLLRWKITEGYYLYLDRFSVKDATGNKLEYETVEGNSKTKDDPAFGLVEVFYQEWAVKTKPGAEGDLTVRYQGCADAGLCYPPTIKKVYWTQPTEEGGASNDLNKVAAAVADGSGKQASVVSEGAGLDLAGKGLFWVVLAFFGIGLGLAFTPCVLPMLPILSSVVVNHRDNGKGSPALSAITYVLGMAITYSLLGVAMAGLGDAVQMQAWLQQPVVVGVFAFLFIVLAMSMFGLYELQLPEVIRSRLLVVGDDSRNHGLFGCLVLGIISALVVSPCVSGPLAGVLIYISTTQDMLLGGAALFAMALGMGVPLVAIALGGRNVIPKTGAWMGQVKVIFGVMLLLMALYIVKHLISLDVMVLVTAVILLVYAVWAGALNSATNGLYRGVLLVVFLYSVALAVSGLSGKASFIQPLAGLVVAGSSSEQSSVAKLDAVTVLPGAELTREMSNAVANNQPVMLDVLADWCVSCFVMEAEILVKDDVRAMMSNVKLIKVDITDVSTENANFLKAEQLFGPPAFLFYDGAGKEIGRLVGEVTKSEFIEYYQSLGL